MDISIIVPVYNVEKYLEDCLDSLIMQKFNGKYEIICINDGSPDNSDKILRSYEKKYSMIRVINQENKGLSGARNTGIRNAKGKYIMFIDSDDYVNSDNILDILYREATDNNLEIVMANFEFDYGIKNLNVIQKRNDSMKNKVMKGEDLLNIDLENMYVWNKLYRKDFIINNNLFFTEGILYEDSDFTPKAYYLASKVKYIDQVTYCYRQREGSIVQDASIPIDDIFIIVDNLSEFNRNYNSKSLLHVELDIFDKFLIRNLNQVKDKKQRKIYKMKMKEREIPRKFFYSDRMYFKIYGLLYLLGMSEIFRIKYSITKLVKSKLNKEQIKRIRMLRKRLLN